MCGGGGGGCSKLGGVFFGDWTSSSMWSRACWPFPLWVWGVGWGWPSPLCMWLALGGMKRHDLRSSPLSCVCGWMGVSQTEELRRPFVSLHVHGMGMREEIEDYHSYAVSLRFLEGPRRTHILFMVGYGKRPNTKAYRAPRIVPQTGPSL